jgi:hypothetical protein
LTYPEQHQVLPNYFVTAAWLLSLLTAILFLISYGSNVAEADEWTLVPYITGNVPVTLEYLWSQHNEHRIFLPRATYFALAKLSHCNFRTGTFFNVAVLGAVALSMVLAAKHMRGGTSYSDAFFPIAILSLGQFETFLLGFQLNFVLTASLASYLLLVIARTAPRIGWSQALLGSISLLGLPLCGMHGVLLAPFLALWWIIAGVVHCNRVRKCGILQGATMILCAVGAGILCCAYFINYQPMISIHPPCPSVTAGIQSTLQFLCNGFGPAAAAGWPFLCLDPRSSAGSGWVFWGIITAIAVCASFLLLAVTLWHKPDERLRALGLGLFLAAICFLGAGIAWGRAGLGQNYLLSRSTYVTLAMLVPCTLYFIAGMYAPLSVARFIQYSLCVLVCLFMAGNAERGVDMGRGHYKALNAIEIDMRAGYTSAAIAAKHHTVLWYPEAELVPRLEMLRRAQVGRFKYMAPAASP